MSADTIETISPRELAERAQAANDLDLIDVRTPAEFRELHVEFARNLPLDKLDAAELIRSRAGRPQQPLYVVCQSGSRAAKACEALRAAGIERVYNVEGGTPACAAAGLPVIRGKKTISLERQVRIVAGSLVFLGTILAWLVHPVFLVLPAFVGTGLIFAGVTDYCGMGLLLAKMPWNQVADDSESCSL